MNQLPFHIPDELFALAKSSSFQGSYQLDELKLSSDTYRFLEPLFYEITVTNTGGSFYISGFVSGKATTECVRCLEDAVYDLEGEIEAYYIVSDSDVVVDGEDDEVEYEILPEDHLIDLEPLIRAALVLELPYVPLCKDDCKGLCPKCGANLNDGPCNCALDDIDESNPFAILKTITFDND